MTPEIKVYCNDASHAGKKITLYRLPLYANRAERLRADSDDWQLVNVPMIDDRQMIDNPRTIGGVGAADRTRFAAVLACERCGRKVEYRRASDLVAELTRRVDAGATRVSLAELDTARQRATGR